VIHFTHSSSLACRKEARLDKDGKAYLYDQRSWNWKITSHELFDIYNPELIKPTTFVVRRNTMKEHSVQVNFHIKSGSLIAMGMVVVLILFFCLDARPTGALSIRTAPIITDWNQATNIPHTSLGHAFAQCPGDPNSFYIILGDTLRYHVDSGVWEEELAPAPNDYWLASAVCYQGKIYLAGGEYYGSVDAFSIYDIALNTWIEGPDMPRFETGAAIAAWDGKIYILGGAEVYGGTPTKHVDAFDIATNSWTAEALPPIPNPTYFAGFAQAGPYIYLVGGLSGDTNHNTNATQRLDLANGQWELGPEFTSARAGFALSVTDHHLYAIGGDEDGGTDGDTIDLVEVLDLSDWPNGSWQDLGDPLPKPSQANFNYACTEALTGGEIWSIGGANVSVWPWEEFDTNLYHPAEPCVQNILNLSDSPMYGEGKPGSAVTYTVDITNTGNIVDYYNLFIANEFPGANPLGGHGPVEPGETIQVVIGIDLPSDAPPNGVVTSTVTVESLRDPNIMDAIQIFTTIGPAYKPELMPETLEGSGIYGEIITYTLTLSNKGTVTDTINLTYTGNNWEVAIPMTSFELGIDDSEDFMVIVTIPQGVHFGDVDDFTLTAISAGNLEATDESKLTTVATWQRKLIPLAMKN